ncbi:hypothetical protein PMAC_002811 [Pneumocystis sp. 'macacae']|nr:hypothetical protein PMAC_002811 [Pneumocystis sp. 'macacae']
MVLKVQNPNNVKVYTVSGEGVSESLPDWLVRKKKKALKKNAKWRSRIELLQDFEFPEASNKIKTTPDGKYAIATGTYKPHMKIFEFSEMSMKFSRYTDSENVNFEILSDDWTKTVHLQQDRSIEFHTQGGMYYRLRIPKFGHDIGYHFPSCDLLIAASGDEVYRLNLDQGRFLSPFKIESLRGTGSEANKMGVNTININPVHQLFAFGTDNGTVEFWDPRYRSRINVLDVHGSLNLFLTKTTGVTATSFRNDGLNFSVGTSTGIVLLYDLRSPKALLQKDQGYDNPIKSIKWLESYDSMSQLILTSDKKIVKIWDKNFGKPFTSIEPPVDINDVCPLNFTGMIFVANEGSPMHIYYIPELGPAPSWCSFLDNLTEEMEENPSENVYENYKFLTKKELNFLGLDHLIGSNVVRSYMHGFFIDFRLYETAKSIVNPFAYAEYREKVIKSKIEKERESRIRSSTKITKVNNKLAQRLLNKEKYIKKNMNKKDASIFEDERFKDIFNDPEYEIDENSLEFMQLNPTQSTKNYQNTDSEDDLGSEESATDSFLSSETNESYNNKINKISNFQNPKSKISKTKKKKLEMKIIDYHQPQLNTTQNESFESLIKIQEQKAEDKDNDLAIKNIKQNINGVGNMEMTFSIPEKKNNAHNINENNTSTNNNTKQTRNRRSASKNVFRNI